MAAKMTVTEVFEAIKGSGDKNVSLSQIQGFLENLGAANAADDIVAEQNLKKFAKFYHVDLPPKKKKKDVPAPQAPSAPQARVASPVLSHAPSAIDVTPVAPTLPVGSKVRLSALVLPRDASQALSWSSSDPDVVLVDQSGVAEARKPGQVVITAASKDVPAVKSEVKIEVPRPRVHSLVIKMTPSRLTVGSTATLSVVVTPAFASEDVTYATSDASIATVDASGIVTALSEGRVMITAVSQADPSVGRSLPVSVVSVDDTSEDTTAVDDSEDRGGTKKVKAKKQQQTISRKREPAHLDRTGYRKGQHRSRTESVRPDFIYYDPGMTVAQCADALHASVAEVIKGLFSLGLFQSGPDPIDRSALDVVADSMGVKVRDRIDDDMTRFEKMKIEDDPKDLLPRPPIVTVMGHVDHGKTTLLDYIRKTHVAAREAGGITQAIGAYQVNEEGRLITFIDTPGHAAFTEMRARGAAVTDIVVLVVAADDGVMPQTIEAIDHAKAAKVPMIVAVNKMDKPQADPTRVLTELSQHGVLPEAWGGDVPCVEISAKTGQGVPVLLDTILTLAELSEFKANPSRPALGVVLEARLDKGKGPVATVIVQNGTLHEGDALVVGNIPCKIRTLTDETRRKLKEARPSKAVEIDGLADVPEAGDHFMVFPDERTARAVAEKRGIRSKQAEQKNVTLASLFTDEAGHKMLNIVLKADVQGSVEAIVGSLSKIKLEGVEISVVHATAGNINDSDIKLAQASNAIILGFNIRPNAATSDMAESAGVEIRCYDIIYELLADIEKAMKGLLAPVYEEHALGEAEVRSLFKASKVGTIAGCMVTHGVIQRSAKVRLVRGGVPIYTGTLGSLKRFKDDAKEVREGFDCGLTIENYNDIKEGDIIQAFVLQQKPVL